MNGRCYRASGPPRGWAARTVRAIACSPASTTSRASTPSFWLSGIGGLNGDLRPDGIVSGSARRVWWRCGRGHAWQISAYNRTGGADRGCPYCGDRKVLKGYNDLRTTYPKIAREWNKERNGDLKPTDVIANSNKRVWWKCKEGHEWSGLIANRARKGKADPGCPYCSGRKVLAGYNDLATTHPDIAAMWHPRMNKRLKPTGVQAVSVFDNVIF